MVIRNKAIMWRVILPAGDKAVTGASIVDEVPAGEKWSYDCATVTDYVKKHTFVVVDPTTPEGKRQSKDTSNGAFGAASTVEHAPEATVTFPEIREPVGDRRIRLASRAPARCRHRR